MKLAKEEDRRLQQFISFTLRGGVLLSSALGIVGAALYLSVKFGPSVSFHAFDGAQNAFSSFRSIARQAFSWNDISRVSRGLAIAQLGILCLMLTPVIRIAASAVGFVARGDRAYTVITALVLAMLSASFLLR